MQSRRGPHDAGPRLVRLALRAERLLTRWAATADAIAAAVESVRRSAPYWAPEIRATKILECLAAHGPHLLAALRSLPADEREACGIDLIREERTTDPWTPPPGSTTRICDPEPLDGDL